MSTIRKKPEIETIIENMSSDERADLLTCINATGPLTNKSLIDQNLFFEALDEGEYDISGVLLQVAPTITLPGIVIRDGNGEWFVQLGNGQNLILYNLDTVNRNIRKIDEELVIEELRRALGDSGEGIVKQIESFEINALQHLIANYNDGTSTDLGAIFSGNVNVTGYIKQATPNYTTTIAFNAISGCDIIRQYCVMEEINGVLHVIVNVKIVNTSESNVTIRSFNSPWKYVSSEIGAKLIDLEGYDVTSDGGNYNTLIAMVPSLSSHNNVNGFNLTPIEGTMRLVNVPSPNGCALSFDIGQNVTLQPNQALYYSARMALTLI